MKKVLILLILAGMIAMSSVAICHAAAGWYTCNVVAAGARNGLTYVKLTDTGATFSNLWYVSAASMANAHLATALTAMSSGQHVMALIDPAHPYTSPEGLFLVP